MLAENAWSADSEWGGVKALCGAAQEWRHLLDGTIYPPVQLPHLNTTSPSRERASRAPLPYAPKSLYLIPILRSPCAYGCPLLYGSRSPRLRYPLTARCAGEPMLCLHPRLVACALEIMERLRPEQQHSPCNGT